MARAPAAAPGVVAKKAAIPRAKVATAPRSPVPGTFLVARSTDAHQ